MNETLSRAPRLPLPQALAGQSVLIIGGSSGIGLAAAHLLADIGAHVTLAARNTERLTAAATQFSGNVRTAQVDVTDPESLGDLISGLPQLDHVFVTAAQVTGGPVINTSYEQVRATIAGWPQGVYNVAHIFAPRLAAGGSLTFTAAVSSVRPLPYTTAAATAAAGVEGMTRALALELAPIRVNVIRSGAADTPMFREFVGDSDDAVQEFGVRLPVGRVGYPPV